MKKIVFWSLVAIAALLYAYDGFLVMRSAGSGRAAAMRAGTAAIRGREAVARLSHFETAARFTPKARDPFRFSAAVDAPPVVARPPRPLAVVASAPPAGTRPPAFAVNGILWNARNPIVMLQAPNGSVQTVKVGAVLSDGSVVTAIEKDRVCIETNRKEFWIDK